VSKNIILVYSLLLRVGTVHYNLHAVTDCTTVKGLTEGKLYEMRYEMRVAAVNAEGHGQFAQLQTDVKPTPVPGSFSYL